MKSKTVKKKTKKKAKAGQKTAKKCCCQPMMIDEYEGTSCG